MASKDAIAQFKQVFTRSIGLAAGLVLCSVSANADLQLEEGVQAYKEIDVLYNKLSVAVSALDSQSFSEIYAPNGYYLIPKSPMIQGLDGIRADWDAWFSWVKQSNGSLDIDFRIVAREIYAEAIGYDVGYTRTVQKMPGEPEKVYNAKIFLVSKKQPDGTWLVEVDSYSFLEKD